MRADIRFPRACVLCSYFMPPESAPAGRISDVSEGLGHHCEECREHVINALCELMDFAGTTLFPIQDADRNNSRNPARENGH